MNEANLERRLRELFDRREERPSQELRLKVLAIPERSIRPRLLHRIRTPRVWILATALLAGAALAAIGLGSGLISPSAVERTASLPEPRQVSVRELLRAAIEPAGVGALGQYGALAISVEPYFIVTATGGASSLAFGALAALGLSDAQLLAAVAEMQPLR